MSRGAQLFRAATGTQGQKAKRLGLAQQYVSQLCTGKRTPGPELRLKIEKVFSIAQGAWDESDEADEGPPASGASTRDDVPSAPAIHDTAPVPERARALLSWLVSQKALTSEQKNLSAELRQVLAMEAKQAPLEQHPDFGPWVDGLLDALQAVPGALAALDAYLSRTTPEPARKAA